MIRNVNENGSVNVSTSVYTEIAGTAAINCLSVKGMVARSVPMACTICCGRNLWARA